jgi:hypothetical protein
MLVQARLLTDRGLVAKLVGEFDELKRFLPGACACPSDDGSVILALLADPDGRRVTIEADRTGCRGVSNGDVVSIANGLGTPVGPELERRLDMLTA